MDDALVAYGQNGEPLRPEQGYPLRLLLPGWEGNANVKWLRRLKVMDQPAMTREETSKYTDLMPDGTARQFTFDMEPKSLITRPSGGDTLAGPGLYELTGIAWSGRGTIARVEITTDGGATWNAARAADAGAAARAHALPLVVEVGRGRRADRVALHRRHRLHAAAAAGSDQGPRHELAVSQQRHPGVEGRVGRKDHQWQSRISASRSSCSLVLARATSFRVAPGRRAIPHVRRRPRADAGGAEGDRHRGDARRQGTAARQRHRGRRQVGVYTALRNVSRPDGHGRSAGGARRRPGLARDVEARRRPSAATGRTRRRCGTTSAARCRSIIPAR